MTTTERRARAAAWRTARDAYLEQPSDANATTYQAAFQALCEAIEDYVTASREGTP
jgi:hypothetical protein